MRTLRLLPVLIALAGCPEKPPPPPPAVARCEVDLAATGLFSNVGSGSAAAEITSTEQLLTGPYAQGAIGDYLLQNDKISVVIQRPTREASPLPFGAAIIDADLRRPAAETGRDALGKLGMLYSLGRTIQATQMEILNDGSQGGAAVIAATGLDQLNDYLNIPNVLEAYGAGLVELTVDPDVPVPLRGTTYFVLSPGENRVRMLTAFCNEGHANVVVPIGDLLNQGGALEYFNPAGCTNGLGGDKGCPIDTASYYGLQGDQVAYGFRSYKFADPSRPETASATIAVSGIVTFVAGTEGQAGLLSWMDPGASRRPGAFGIPGGGQRNYVRDFYVTRDLGELSSQLLQQDGVATGRLNVTVTHAGGAPAVGARVAVLDANNSREVTVLVARSDGRAKVDLPPGSYKLSAALEGYAPGPVMDAQIAAGANGELSLSMGATRKLTVSVKDPFGAPLSAKVTVLCPTGLCPVTTKSYVQYVLVEELPDNVAAVGFVPPQGSLELNVPPGAYEVVVTRGPEYSAWPDAWPVRGQAVDLTAQDQGVEAVLGHVVDSTGWISADLHVHSIDSSDSSVLHDQRVLSFLAEGVDVLVSTDHDVIADLSPSIRALGAEAQIAYMLGAEVSTFDYGHFNAFPLTRNDTPTGGSFDWANAEGPSLRLGQLFAGLRERFPEAIIQLNHSRHTGAGALSDLRVDTATGASHADPARFRMEPAPDATPTDTKLFSSDFDVFEVANGPSPKASVLNDWMTFLSRGLVKTGTGVSDSHLAKIDVGGYARTFVKLDQDLPAQFDPKAFTAALKRHEAFGSSGLFLQVTARRVDAGGQALEPGVEMGGTLSVSPSAGETVELTVDVQAPEWVRFDTIEVYTHAAGREAVDGQPNDTWPPERMLAVKKLDPLALNVEPVPDQNGLGFRRVHVTERFVVSPSSDTWYVVLVKDAAQTGSLFPMVIPGTRANAFSNPILVDADGSGAYDNFPIPVQQGLSLPPKRSPQRKLTLEEIERAFLEWARHDHHAN